MDFFDFLLKLRFFTPFNSVILRNSHFFTLSQFYQLFRKPSSFETLFYTFMSTIVMIEFILAGFFCLASFEMNFERGRKK